MKLNIISFILLVFFTQCQKEPHGYFKNQTLKNKVHDFIKNARYYSSDTVNKNVTINIERENTYYKINFEFIKPDCFSNLVTVFEENTYQIFILSKNDISELIYSSKQFEIDTLKYYSRANPWQIVDWYSDFYYFDKKNFVKDTLLFNQNKRK